MQLFMTELAVADWSSAFAWYRDVLGLPVGLLDEPRRFALLGDDGGRLALIAREVDAALGRHRLVFLVSDLDAQRWRLAEAGVEVGEIVQDDREGYRAFGFVGPEGTPIRLFSWTGRPE